MKVESLMTRDVKTCGTEDSLATAAAIMWQNDCGCVPVVDESRQVVGMLTDRDLCMASWMQGQPLQNLPVTLPMSKPVWSCRADDTLNVAERTMRERRVRRLPVVDAKGRLVGLLSLNDIAREAKTARSAKRPAEVSDAELRETFAAVCEPRTR